jgi:hypothetical protein
MNFFLGLFCLYIRFYYPVYIRIVAVVLELIYELLLFVSFWTVLNASFIFFGSN